MAISLENAKLDPVAAADCGDSPQGMGRSGASGAHAAAPECESLEWLEDSTHPLDWNGPTGRIFTRFRDEDLDRPIIDHFERVTRQHRN